MKKLFDIGCFTVCKIDNDYMVLEYDGIEYLHKGYFRTEMDAVDYCNNYYY